MDAVRINPLKSYIWRKLRTMRTAKIDTTGVHYFSQLDENHFFQWAQQIPCIKSVDQGILHIDTQFVSDEALRELLALFTRFGLSIEPLRVLVDSSSESWFNEPEMYWNKSP